MLFTNKEVWEKCLANNDNGCIDTYGGSVLFFSQHWANLMEAAIAQEVSLENCAKDTSHRASKDMGRFSITGFQYGCAVSILSQTWIHGEELRHWHNRDVQIGSEGEEANSKGNTLNPALLLITSKGG